MIEKIKAIMQNRRLVAIIAGVLILVVIILIVMFTTAKKPDGTFAFVSEPDYETNITFQSLYQGDSTYGDIIKQFEALPQNKNVKINLVVRSDGASQNYYNSLINAFALDAGPDIFGIRNDEKNAYLKFISPLSDVKDETGQVVINSVLKANYRQNFVDLAVKDTMYRDEIYGITSYVDNLQLYYNKDLLNQAGYVRPPSTWTELENQLSNLNKRDLGGIDFTKSAVSLGTGFTRTGASIFGDVGININRFQDIIAALIFQSGGQLYDSDTNQVLFGKKSNGEEDPALNAVKFYGSFGDINSNRYSWNTTSPNNIDAFVQNKLAYIIHYKYLQDIIASRNPSLKYDVSPLPQLDTQNKKTYGTFFMNVMSRKNFDKCAANQLDGPQIRKCNKIKEFLYYLSTRYAQENFALKTSLPSAHRDVIALQQQGDARLRNFANGAVYAENYYKPDIEKTERIFGDLIYRVQLENNTIERSYEQAVQDYNGLVQGNSGQ
jgi:ABC-type glycerol-3-phosphate transport system substrate-binding protein